jgi:hypothetical protein
MLPGSTSYGFEQQKTYLVGMREGGKYGGGLKGPWISLYMYYISMYSGQPPTPTHTFYKD